MTGGTRLGRAGAFRRRLRSLHFLFPGSERSRRGKEHSLDYDSSPAGCCASAISPHTSHDLISQVPAPSPCTLCLEWEGNERKSRTHILPAAVSSQRSVPGAESFSNPLQGGLLLCWLQIKSFHTGKKHLLL